MRGITALADTKQNRKLKKVDFNAIEAGKYTVLYISPEKLLEDVEWRALSKKNTFRSRIAFFAIDEAHCVETWGSKFRLAYGKLGEIRIRFRCIPVIALSATFSNEVFLKVKEVLKMEDGKFLLIKENLDRSNIFFAAKQITGPKDQRLDLNFLTQDKLGTILDNSKKIPQTVVFHDQIKDCRVSQLFLDKRLEAAGMEREIDGIRIVEEFHKDLTDSSKTRLLKDFRIGKIRILVATEAFGLGIDIPTIERVVIYGIVNRKDHKLSIETIVQRLGRAGRGGQAAVAIVFYNNWCYGPIAVNNNGQNKQSTTQKRKRSGSASSTISTKSVDTIDSDNHSELEDIAEQTKVQGKGENTHAQLRAKMDINTYFFINTTSCRRFALLKPFLATSEISATNCKMCDNCWISKEVQGLAGVARVTGTVLKIETCVKMKRRVPLVARSFIINYLIKERDFLYDRDLYAPITLSIPERIYTTVAINRVSTSWGEFDSYDAFVDCIKIKEPWKSNESMRIYNVLLKGVETIIQEGKIETQRKRLATMESNRVNSLPSPLQATSKIKQSSSQLSQEFAIFEDTRQQCSQEGNPVDTLSTMVFYNSPNTTKPNRILQQINANIPISAAVNAVADIRKSPRQKLLTPKAIEAKQNLEKAATKKKRIQ
jgi:superfamily II DNA helicase RecQ